MNKILERFFKEKRIQDGIRTVCINFDNHNDIKLFSKDLAIAYSKMTDGGISTYQAENLMKFKNSYLMNTLTNKSKVL